MLFSVNLKRTFPSSKLQLSFGFQASLLLVFSCSPSCLCLAFPRRWLWRRLSSLVVEWLVQKQTYRFLIQNTKTTQYRETAQLGPSIRAIALHTPGVYLQSKPSRAAIPPQTCTFHAQKLSLDQVSGGRSVPSSRACRICGQQASPAHLPRGETQVWRACPQCCGLWDCWDSSEALASVSQTEWELQTKLIREALP